MGVWDPRQEPRSYDSGAAECYRDYIRPGKVRFVLIQSLSYYFLLHFCHWDLRQGRIVI